MKPTNFAVDHSVAVYVLILIIGLAGLASYQAMPREASPDVTIPVVVVTTPYFGVSPVDIESLVTQPIEDELQDLKGVDEIRSTSAESMSIITVQFSPDVDLDDAIQRMREKVDKAKPELPADAEDPELMEINFSEFPIMLVNLHGDADVLALKEIGESLQKDIEKIDGVLSVTLAGGLEREIHVDVDPERLDYYELSVTDLINALQRENVNLPGGSVDVGRMDYLVRVDGEFKNVETIGDIVIKDKAGQPIFVKDVARIEDGYKERTSMSRFNGSTTVSLSVQKRAGENLVRISDEVKALVAGYEARLPEGVDFSITADMSVAVRDQVADLENNILTGLLLVVAVLFFFMGGVRNSLFVAAAIPLSMLLSFMVLDAMGVTLNMVVLFSLVLALGMLVDNAIVIVENIYRHATEGKTRVQAAKDAVAEVGWPVISSTATTVAAFAPMLFWPGIIGEFMGFLPMTVIIVLVASLAVGLLINPVLCSTLLRVTGEQANEEDSVPDNAMYRAYKASLIWAIDHRWLVMVMAVGSLVGTFVAYGLLGHGVEFFPEATPKRAFLKVRTPDGTRLETTEALASSLETKVGELDNIKSMVVSVGGGGGGGGGPQQPGGGGGGANSALFTLDFQDAEVRSEDPRVTMEKIRAMTAVFAGAEFELEKESNAPPSGKPINIEIVGDDYQMLGAVAEQMRGVIRDVPGLTDLKDDYVSVRPEIRVEVDRKEAALLGVNTFVIADTVRSAINGNTAIKLRDKNSDEVDVVVRVKPEARRTLEDIRSLKVPGRDGVLVPLREVAELKTAGGTGSIRHVGLDRVVSVTANVQPGVLPADVLLKVQKKMEGFERPAAIDIRYTGENQDQEEAANFLGRALLAALFMITLVLVTQFNSILQPLVIVASVFLSLIGVLWGLILTQTPFGIIMVGIGIISLAGVVVNNAIVLIDYTNQLKERGRSMRDAVITAGLVRFRPVLLTAATTILGLMPMVVGISIDFFNLELIMGSQSVEMWGPMARSVASGLLVATILTLIVVPVMYTFADDAGLLLARLWGGERRPGRQSSKAAQTGQAPAAARAVEPLSETLVEGEA